MWGWNSQRKKGLEASGHPAEKVIRLQVIHNSSPRSSYPNVTNLTPASHPHLQHLHLVGFQRPQRVALQRPPAPLHGCENSKKRKIKTFHSNYEKHL
jgi:hypothetical protein